MSRTFGTTIHGIDRHGPLHTSTVPNAYSVNIGRTRWQTIKQDPRCEIQRFCGDRVWEKAMCKHNSATVCISSRTHISHRPIFTLCLFAKILQGLPVKVPALQKGRVQDENPFRRHPLNNYSRMCSAAFSLFQRVYRLEIISCVHSVMLVGCCDLYSPLLPLPPFSLVTAPPSLCQSISIYCTDSVWLRGWQKPKRVGGPLQINTRRKVPFQVTFLWRHFALLSIGLTFLWFPPGNKLIQHCLTRWEDFL